MMARTTQRDALNVLCVRERFSNGQRTIGMSMVMRVEQLAGEALAKLDADSTVTAAGWERNKHGKLAPRRIELGASMDPKRLAATAVDLNLKLMRWRLLPSVELEKVRDTRCLLLGSGTLGCNVARQLLSWGVRHVTMVDSGKVSFSNPVRQTLFEFADCIDGGRPKAQAAAAKLEAIFPDVKTKGIQLSIPMPVESLALLVSNLFIYYFDICVVV